MPATALVSRSLIALLLAGAAGSALAQGSSLQLDTSTFGRWQARLQLSSSYAPSAYDNQRQQPSRLLSANLLGDYYLTGSGLGASVQGGLRATGGLLLGPLSLSQSNAGLALGSQAYGLSPNFAFGQRSLGMAGNYNDRSDPSTSLSYLGIGYTGQSLRGGWGFSADLGLIGGGGLRLGNSNSQSVDDLLRDMRLKPVVQLGVSYSY
ncbi:hypothetical protein RQP53_17755 [Paucibacter sp. APW11]|uniref:Outer membrane protein beta-barrel domain-containing protein n=1 Tax=Roseateles aquae TaxID=3077235 RepID=A0ABU3PF21_9BURK|nr:hypothetical protein [Paucibacter sp. APW11]MDT9001128.1 hypothetical protein [Paucibacter sp. APW11]